MSNLSKKAAWSAGVSLSLMALVSMTSASAQTEASVPAPADVPESGVTVIVTGTRETGRKARDSATPIDVITAADLRATGQTNLLDALKNVLPSLNGPAVGYDVGALARTFQLRGLSPAHTLVLVNGKRRHLSAGLYADSDPAQGANAVDLDLIPLAAIDHIEVLRDGAAAQYGSDAIAGVINIILKSSGKGGSLSVLGGSYYKGDGASGQIDVEAGVKLGQDGTLNVSAGYRHHDFSNRSGETGDVQTAKVQGDPQSDVATLGFNLVKPLNDAATVYSFGTAAHRKATAWENPRQPGWVSDATDLLYPNGFTPQEKVDEADYSLTAGVRGQTGNAWNWDLSATYGRDEENLRNVKTVNPDLLADTGNAQSDFYVGAFISSELTTNLDIKRAFNVGLAAPLNVAVGVEARHETYEIKAGEPNSYYGGGPSAFPGFRPSDAVKAERDGLASYVDLSTLVTPKWELGLAVRAEHYDGVGDTQTGKLSTRYNLSPTFALRGTLSSGFHAPTLAQQYYSATTVTTGYASIQLPLGSPGAAILGAPDLKPENSRSISAGFVAEPVRGLHVSLDAYTIAVDDRIIESAYLYDPLALAAIEANGSVVPSELDPANVAAVFFTNGVDTRTDGVDITADWRQQLGELGAIKWTFAGSYNKTTIRAIHDAPAVLEAAGLGLVDAVQRSNLTTATPQIKASLAGVWTSRAWAVTLRNTYYSKTTQAQGYAEPYYKIATKAAVITDLDLGYRFNDGLRLNIGASNLFNVYPTKIAPEIYQNLNYDKYSHVSPYGINGGTYYARLTASF
ncbi:TonB-dependent receptor plug domain-containing protein [Asticcacaulis benevestitus]|nr:TonB-dependent receptor [Asticcacaulis benevestitus]